MFENVVRWAVWKALYNTQKDIGDGIVGIYRSLSGFWPSCASHLHSVISIFVNVD